jgi:hypothetical protein
MVENGIHVMRKRGKIDHITKGRSIVASSSIKREMLVPADAEHEEGHHVADDLVAEVGDGGDELHVAVGMEALRQRRSMTSRVMATPNTPSVSASRRDLGM